MLSSLHPVCFFIGDEAAINYSLVSIIKRTHELTTFRHPSFCYGNLCIFHPVFLQYIIRHRRSYLISTNLSNIRRISGMILTSCANNYLRRHSTTSVVRIRRPQQTSGPCTLKHAAVYPAASRLRRSPRTGNLRKNVADPTLN
jgi:hypothetical protein